MKKVNGNSIDKNYCHRVYDFTKIDKYITKYFCAHGERIKKLKLLPLKNSFSFKKIYKKMFFNIVGPLPHHDRGHAPSCPLVKFSIRCRSCGKLYPLGRCLIFLPSRSLDYITWKLNNLLKSAFFGFNKIFSWRFNMVSQVKFAVKDVDGLISRFRYAVMITLTSSGNFSDGSVFSNEFNHFIIYLKRYLKDKDLYYVVVREKQQRGAYHYHVVLFGYKFIPYEVLSSFWRLGYVWISFISNREGVEYILKYVKKGNQFGRLHASYTFLKLFKVQYSEWVNFWRRSFFFGRLVDYVAGQLKVIDFDKLKEWFYKEFSKFRIGIDNIMNVANACLLAFA